MSLTTIVTLGAITSKKGVLWALLDSHAEDLRSLKTMHSLSFCIRRYFVFRGDKSPDLQTSNHSMFRQFPQTSG